MTSVLEFIATAVLATIFALGVAMLVVMWLERDGDKY